jgi:hypothetical protein
MRTMRMILLALVAVLALGAVAASAASAEVLFKQEKGTFKSVGGVSKLTGAGGTIECKKATNSGEITTKHLGTFSILFEECTGPFGSTCTTAGFAKGHINTGLMDLHLGLAEKKPAVLLEILKNVTFTCEVIGIKVNVEVKGSVVGLLTTVGGGAIAMNTKYSELELHVEEAGGKQKHETFELSLGGGVMEKVHLESNENGGAFSAAVQTSEKDILNTFVPEVEFEEA